LLVQRTSRPLRAATPGLYYFALGHKLDSVTLVWPAKVGTIPGAEHGGLYYVPDDSCDAPVYAVVTNPDEWRGWRFAWRSPVWQYMQFPAARGHHGAFRGIRAFPVGLPEPLLDIAARCAFWLIPLTTLRVMAKDRKIVGCTSKVGLLKTLVLMVMHILRVTELEALDIVRFRIATMSESQRATVAEIISLGEGINYFNRNERDALLSEKKKLEEHDVDVGSITDEFALARSRLLEGAARRKIVKRLIPEGELMQQDVAGLTPPGGHIWRDNVSDAWCGHYKPYARMRCLTVEAGTVRDAALNILRRLWRQHLRLMKMDDTECTVLGLWPGPVGPVAAAAAAASASGHAAASSSSAAAPAAAPAAKRSRR
jgi:hypothetical protein